MALREEYIAVLNAAGISFLEQPHREGVMSKQFLAQNSTIKIITPFVAAVFLWLLP